MDFENIQKPNYEYDICWFEITELLKDTSRCLRSKKSNSVEEKIIQLFDRLFHISVEYKLDMNKAWDRWNKKAKTKKYDHSET